MEYQPDTVLLNESASPTPTHILKLSCEAPALIGARVIIMRANHNIFDVYKISRQACADQTCDRQQFNVMKQEELVAVVNG